MRTVRKNLSFTNVEELIAEFKRHPSQCLRVVCLGGKNISDRTELRNLLILMAKMSGACPFQDGVPFQMIPQISCRHKAGCLNPFHYHYRALPHTCKSTSKASVLVRDNAEAMSNWFTSYLPQLCGIASWPEGCIKLSGGVDFLLASQLGMRHTPKCQMGKRCWNLSHWLEGAPKPEVYGSILDTVVNIRRTPK